MMSDAVMPGGYEKRRGPSRGFNTPFVADAVNASWQKSAMPWHDDILRQLVALKEAGKLRNRDIEKLLKLPSSRVSEIFRGDRRINADEAAILVAHYKLDNAGPPTADTDRELEAILLPLADLAGLDDARADLMIRVFRASLSVLRAASVSDERLPEQARLLVQGLWQSLPRQEPSE